MDGIHLTWSKIKFRISRGQDQRRSVAVLVGDFADNSLVVLPLVSALTFFVAGLPSLLAMCLFVLPMAKGFSCNSLTVPFRLAVLLGMSGTESFWALIGPRSCKAWSLALLRVDMIKYRQEDTGVQ